MKRSSHGIVYPTTVPTILLKIGSAAAFGLVDSISESLA